MTENFWVQDTFNLAYQNDIFGYFLPRNFPSFLLTDLVQELPHLKLQFSTCFFSFFLQYYNVRF